MKYFLHNPDSRVGTHFLLNRPENLCLAGPFTSVNSAHQWRRLTLSFDQLLPTEASVELATFAHEKIGRFGDSPLWLTLSEQRELQQGKTDSILVRVFKLFASAGPAIFDAVRAEAAATRTPLLPDKFAEHLAPRLDGDREVRNEDTRSVARNSTGAFSSNPEVGDEIPSPLACIRQYPMNATDVTIWHEPGDRRGDGTQLWVLLRIRIVDTDHAPILKCIELESQEYGWERELPEIYSQTDPIRKPDDRRINTVGLSILLESLLRLFETNTAQQQDRINRVSDWFVPSARTTNPRKLAQHLGMNIDGLKEEQISKLLPKAFQAFLKRGTKDSFLATLRLIYDDTKRNVIFGLREPLFDCRLMILDGSCRLDDPNIVVSGVRTLPAAKLDRSKPAHEQPTHELTGLQHLVGRAYLQVNADAFGDETDERRVLLKSLVEQLSPAHMRIGVEFVGDVAVLDRGARVEECSVG